MQSWLVISWIVRFRATMTHQLLRLKSATLNHGIFLVNVIHSVFIIWSQLLQWIDEDIICMHCWLMCIGHSKNKSDNQACYFFCALDLKYVHSQRIRRTTKVGYWKPTGKVRKVKASGKSKNVIGTKRTLVFYNKAGLPKPVKSQWIMHEYHSIPQVSHQPNSLLKLVSIFVAAFLH